MNGNECTKCTFVNSLFKRDCGEDLAFWSTEKKFFFT